MNFTSINISEIRQAEASLVAAFAHLMPQLSASVAVPGMERLRQIVESPNMRLFAARRGVEVVGVLSLAWYDVPSGRRAWIEDVVVDVAYRGQGVGEALVDAAIETARRVGADTVSLTSHASREAAHALYRKAGFEPYDTTVFRLKINL